MLKMMEMPPRFTHIIRMIYSLPASIIVISGVWKLGKTDFALLIAQILLEMGLIKHVASNIQTGDERVKYIHSLSRLKYWMFSEKGRKLFIYDEPIESTPKRKAMSTINVEWVRTIPQLSKARAHIIVCTQAESLTESVFFNPVFCRGIWYKLAKKVARFSSPMMKGESYVLRNIPATNIPFDPYLIAIIDNADRRF